MTNRMPEIRTVPVAHIEIPVELSRLYDIAYNLWWTWQPRAQLLFNAIDPDGWQRDHNPVELLINVEPYRWEDLLRNESFLSIYNGVVQDFDRYLDTDDTWFRRTFPDLDGGPVAYFSTEYGWHESLGIYSGGLGILSGDHSKAASDLGIPFVGVGLMYRRGYFRQRIDADGQQQHLYPNYDFRRLPVLPITHPNGRRMRVAVDFPGRQIHLRLWKATVGRVPVILLDSDSRENDPADRPITSILYVRGREMRLCQEMVLGAGGVLALRALGIEPSAWHINEGHSALLALQRLRNMVEHGGLTSDEALRRIPRNTLFTTHTPVPAGNEIFDLDLVRKYIEVDAERAGIPTDDLLALGDAHRDDEHGRFNLTALAIRTTHDANGVSELHGGVASDLWRHLWPDDRREGRVVGHVTNGVHLQTWLGPEIALLLGSRGGEEFENLSTDGDFAERVGAIPDHEVWTAHLAQKTRLLLFAREKMLGQFARHGRSPDELRLVQDLLDPEALTIGFARRFATYKRAALIFRDPERLHRILSQDGRPVQILFAGKAHPADRPGQDLIRDIFHKSLSPEFRGRIVFLEDYDIRVGRHLVQGVDLWLNTPLRPHEASGTSGMKAAINGGLNCSVLDGWWCEGYDPSHGWAIGEPREYSDAEAQNHEDAEALYRVLADEIVPCFFDRDDNGIPSRWVERMKKAVGKLTPRFCAARMVREYAEKYYVPAAVRRESSEERDESPQLSS